MNYLEKRKITKYIFLKPKLEKASLAIVFGTRHQEIVKKILEIYRQEIAPIILISGGINKITGENEAQKIGKELIKNKIKEGSIILEDKSTNSLQNVIFSKNIIEREIGFNNIKKILVITKHYHMRRALMTLYKNFPKNIEFLPAPYQIYGFTEENWFKKEKGKEKVLSEINKIKKYLKKGDIKELPF